MTELVYSREKRVALERLPPLWPTERRQRYLLLDVQHPLSADPRVWPLDPDRADAVDIVTTAIGSDVRAVQVWLGIADPIDAAPELADAERLGYDVCDSTLTSGLLNCGYTDDEKSNLASWAALLNEWHLFGELETAKQFVSITERRVPEHAPFGVFGVYRR